MITYKITNQKKFNERVNAIEIFLKSMEDPYRSELCVSVLNEFNKGNIAVVEDTKDFKTHSKLKKI